MDSPIKILEGISGEAQNWLYRQFQRGEIQAKIDALRLFSWTRQKGADAEQAAIQEQISSLKDDLNKL